MIRLDSSHNQEVKGQKVQNASEGKFGGEDVASRGKRFLSHPASYWHRNVTYSTYTERSSCVVFFVRLASVWCWHDTRKTVIPWNWEANVGLARNGRPPLCEVVLRLYISVLEIFMFLSWLTAVVDSWKSTWESSHTVMFIFSKIKVEVIFSRIF